MINGHGDDLHLYPNVWANFSSNVYSAADHRTLIAHLREHIHTLLSSYPEPEPYTLQRELAKALGRIPNEVLVTNGATEAIYLIAQLMRGGRTYILEPTFSEYADACQMAQHELVTVPCSIHQLDSYWICNPNNPTGQILDEIGLEVEKYPNTLFVIDRSYEYFARHSLSRELRANNVIYIHSLTKRYRIPGLRLGYITGSEQILKQLRTLRQPWSVNALAIEAGRWIVQQGFPHTIDRLGLWKETDRLREALVDINGIEVEATDTHFMLLRLPLPAAEIKAILAHEYGLLVRDASNFRGLSEQHIRIATQTPRANDALIAALTNVLI